jgi:hypothetical protein
VECAGSPNLIRRRKGLRSTTKRQSHVEEPSTEAYYISAAKRNPGCQNVPTASDAINAVIPFRRSLSF